MACGKQFTNSSRLQPTALWQQYIEGKQSYQQLAARYNCPVKTIQRKIDAVEVKQHSSFPAIVNVLMDTTYFGRKLGIMVVKDSISSQILYKQYVRQETNRLYLSDIEEISRRGIKVQSIICNGRKGLMQLFEGIPVQMCQFHQIIVIRRYLTKKPKLEAGKELWAHVMLLTKTDKESFEGGLAAWYNKMESFLNERKKDACGKNRYVHKKLRSDYRSLKTNLPWLFTWYDHMNLKIPDTTNAIDGHFADLKNKLRNHNGLSIERKKKFTDEFLKA